MRAYGVFVHRLLAAGTLLLATSLEISGCNTMPNCQRVLGQQVPFDWQTRMEHCAPCISIDRASNLSQERGRLETAGATLPLRLEDTVQALREDGGVSLYQAAGGMDSPVSTLPLGESSALDTASYLPRILPDELYRALPAELSSGPSSIPESVLFLYPATQLEGTPRRKAPIATAFVLSVPDRKNRTPARFLVTARHAVDPAWAYCSQQNPDAIQVRLNRRTGGVGYETISLADQQGRPTYLTPKDPTLDIAVLRLDPELIPNIERYKFVDTPFRLLPTKSELSYFSSKKRDDERNSPGPTVTTASLRSQVAADFSAFPTSQAGVLYSTANQPVNIQCGHTGPIRPLRVWFIGISVEQGVSGAPVYTSLARNGEGAASTVLLGVQAIAWPDRGVAGITPASALTELIETALANRYKQRNERRRYGREDADGLMANLHSGETPTHKSSGPNL